MKHEQRRRCFIPELTMCSILVLLASAATAVAAVVATQTAKDSLSHENNTNASVATTSSSTDGDNGSLQEIHYDRWAIEDNIESRVVPVLFGLVFILGLVGNGTLIVSVLANKVMRNVPNILIASLSLGDFLLILVSVPLTSVIYTFTNWPFGTISCKLNEYMQTLSLGVSVFTLTALSADRYVAIVDPMAKLTGCTQRTTIGIALAIWFLSALLAIPDAVVSTEVSTIINNNTLLTMCNNFQGDYGTLYPKIVVTVRFVVFFVLPVVTIGFFYSMMARMLIRSSESLPTESKTGAANHHRQIAARKKVARVVLSFVLIFVICWLPRHIYLMWFHFDTADYDFFWHAFKITGFCLKFVNSCVNPFALYFLSGQFRKYYNRYLFCCCRRVRYSSLDSTSGMHNLHSTTRRASPTNMSLLHSQSMC